MKIGIIGLPQTGKKTLFEIITNHKPTENEIASKKPIKGVVEVRDPRFDMLVKALKPKKEVRARIEIELLPKLEKDTMLRSRRYLYYCFMKYVLEYGREPTKEEYIEKYRKKAKAALDDFQKKQDSLVNRMCLILMK